MNTTFESLGIGPGLAEALARHAISEPSPIQREAIPEALAGRDLLAQSQTGTGKTLAYLLPILERIDPAEKELQAIVLAPTRELGVQIAAEIEKYGGPLGIRGQALIGGAAISRQIERLRLHPHLVVGTPGRVAELLKMRKVKLHRVRTIVIDEADQMFALGSAKDAETIVEGALRDRQLLFFSATMPPEVRRMAARWMREPKTIEIDPGRRTAGGIEHLVFVCEEREKVDTLRRLIRLYEPKSALAFVNDLDVIAEVASKLQFAGLPAEALYGDAPKQERTTLLNRFRTGRVKTLVATDVAARGLDVPGLTHVFHLQPAIDADHYVHRAGRTGRMGASGFSISIATEQEMFILRKFEKQLGIVISRKAMYKGAVVEPDEARGAGGGTRPAAKTGAAGKERARTAAATAPAKPPRRTAAAATPTPAPQPDAPPRAAAKPPAPETARAPVPARAKAKAAERERDRKNKGAPRWLKEKAERGGPKPQQP
ncbi:DEAD/DEAH box helicase [Paenibacillus flagellatus]|uniref:RNA helicase n=1 Tax=Paenibacillus flagellatus TaxID=2211139 RepID=A0A2V5JYZ8_9BACL|nr:DEAD/DEAH box helicase [Paenibacillus flagellatus]PYI52149.1 DEAD/DEAH box helicase [Paenibacillus flagellatus]